MTEQSPFANPYVGPRSFTTEDRKIFFGREREARDLLARVLSERLFLFYAQSGAGKSSLLHTRLIPQLTEEKGFAVLPVARVSGELPADIEQVDNIYLFNLMLSIDEGKDPGRLANATLSDFLARLARRRITDRSGQERKGWVYDPDLALPAAARRAGPQRYALIVDQFEEIITAHPDRWREREGFFRQLDDAMRVDPNLWIVLTLRDDYVASLDPYAQLMTDQLRARFYMQRMGTAAALAAVRKPAELGGRPFAPGVAEKLVDDLRQVRVAGQEHTMPGQYVEPVQLQVVCFQLWQRLTSDGESKEIGRQGDAAIETIGSEAVSVATAPTLITEADLAAAGDVNQALEQFYADTLEAVLAEPAVQAAGVNERILRTWFDKELITETGIRGTAYRNETAGITGGLPNAAVDALGRRFLIRTELRGGGAWVELVHDRLVEPIRTANEKWYAKNFSTLQRAASLWNDGGRASGLLLAGDALDDALAWANMHDLIDYEQEFLDACLQARATMERERRQSRRIGILAVIAIIISILAVAATLVAWNQTQLAQKNADLANQQLQGLEGERLLTEARQFKMALDATNAISSLVAASAYPQLEIDLTAEISDTNRYVATMLVQQGEALAVQGDREGASAKFQQALQLDPPSDTHLYVWIEPGEFLMGASEEDTMADDDERPQHKLSHDGYWILRTEVTYEQYLRCVTAGSCDPPNDSRWNKAQFAKQPVGNVNWHQANAYAQWVGGQLPTEAQWENACRGVTGDIYPWGTAAPTAELTNFKNSGLGLSTQVGSYPPGANGLYDMAGNVWEWVNTLWGPVVEEPSFKYPYNAIDGREDPSGPVGFLRTTRGGSYFDPEVDMRCSVRNGLDPIAQYPNLGFRVVSGASGVD